MSDPVSLREHQQALTRARLLDAAETVFGTRGYQAATLAQIARVAGATTGAVYSNFAGKEDLFFALFEERIAGDVAEYGEILAGAETMEEQLRGVARQWMRILRERPHYFPLLIEFWAAALRDPGLRTKFATRFAALRVASARLLGDGAARLGIELSQPVAERLAVLITALGNGIALEKLADPEAIDEELLGDLLVLFFRGLVALRREHPDIEYPAARGDLKPSVQDDG